jgi:hypothetical protein
MPGSRPDCTLTPAEQAHWKTLGQRLQTDFGLPLKTEAFLVLVGMNELGRHLPDTSKQDRLDLMHVGLCTLLPDFYRPTGHTPDGWPLFELTNALPPLDPFEQMNLMRKRLVQYFEHRYPDWFAN